MSGNDEENDEPSRRSTKDKNYGEEPPHDCSNGQFTASATPTAAESKSSISNNHRSSSSVDHLVEMLLKESPKLGTLCESKFADNDEDRKPAAASNQHQPSNPPSLQIVRSTIEAILQSEDIFAQILEQQTSRRKANNRKKKQPKSIADCTDPSRIPIKTVSFSSISAPHDEDEVDNNYNSTDDEIAQHLLPPILPRQQQQQQDRRLVRSNSPSIRYNRRQQQQQQQQQQQNSSSPVADISAGETTASGDSSVISAHNRANASSSPGAAAAASAAQVHFSAMNPNPQLILGSSNNSHGSHTPTVRFTLDRSVSWEDEQLQHGGSRASRSGLSSPSIEPALSPPRSRSRSPLQIHFNDSAIVETITEAAARLRIHNNNNNNNEIYYAANETEKKMAQDPGLVVMVHGLESSSSSPQMIDAATAFLAINMDVICVNFRSCSGEPNRRPGAYHLGFTEDLRFFLSEILPQQNLSMKRDVYLVGFSLGANVILKLLGEMQTSAFSLYNVRGAAVSAAPFDLIKSAPKFAGTMFNRFIYDSNFLRTLKRKAINQYEMLREDVPYNIEEIKRAQSIAEFENAFIAPVYGFTDNVDYYRKTSCISFIDSIRVPTLVINSLDDPFFDPSCYPRECNSRPVKLHYTSYGGHLGFMLHQETSCEDKATATTSSWMPSELARFFKHVRDSIHD
mmetsp:Transcript_17025/g.24245  ORF Transcript_17025/g.24245 Transcript_17025/m.24245 type:complete len:682 (+) Transcript_17025:169-2214(+)